MDQGRLPTQIIGPQGIPPGETFDSPTLWSAYHFAPEWFEDALKETQLASRHARCREILFAVCCVESYIVEWVRDEVLKRNFSKLNTYFKPGERKGVTDKWKDVPKQLLQRRLIPGVPNYGEAWWGSFKKLLDYRNGLVHASASRPDSDAQTKQQNPSPTIAELDDMKPGWAVEVVIELIEKLHQAVGTAPPEWLRKT